MEDIIKFIRELYNTNEFIPLHECRLKGNEKKYIYDCLESNFVSSVGEYVNRFEKMMVDYTQSSYAIAIVNGTCALQVALVLSGVCRDSEVLIPALTFVATANAVSHIGASPIFIDSEKDTFGICPQKLEQFLEKETYEKEGQCYNKKTNCHITACIPVHIFGHPAKIDTIVNICQKYRISIVEDAAESIGSLYQNCHTGRFGQLGVFSFNGNKTITCGGGGIIVTDDQELAKKAKHITTTAKVPHKWEYFHDQVAYNYRLPNINAALACAQMEQLPHFIKNKRQTAQLYHEFFSQKGIDFFIEKKECHSNYWLNAVILSNRKERDRFLEYTNNNGVMTRPIWALLNKLPMYNNNQCTDLSNAQWLESRVVNIPSSVRYT